MLAIKHHARQRGPEHPRDQLSEFSVAEHSGFVKLFGVHLMQNFTRRSQRFDEYSRFIADRVRDQMQIFEWQRQIFRKRAGVGHNAQHFAALAMPPEPASAESANGTESKRPAGNIDFARDTLANPTFLRL